MEQHNAFPLSLILTGMVMVGWAYADVQAIYSYCFVPDDIVVTAAFKCVVGWIAVFIGAIIWK